jgi:hypothetical protein
MIKTSAAVAFTVLAFGATLAAAPASAQDRTPPDSAIQDLTPSIDLRPGQTFMTQRDLYRMQEGRSAARDPDAPNLRDSGAELDR